MKKAAAILCGFIIAIIACIPVKAAEAGRFFRSGYKIDGNFLHIMGTRLPENGTLTVTIGTQKDISAEISSISSENIFTTFYCLVDVSNSMKTEQMTQLKDVIQAKSDNMNDGDNMVLTSLGETVDVGVPLSTAEERNAAIRELKTGAAGTNLYKGIMDSINLLTTSTVYNPNRCLLIISDGRDELKTGATEEEAIEAVRSSTVPVYTVAALRSNAQSEDQEYGKRLRSFATTSLGGIGYTPMFDEISASEAGNDIWNSMQSNTIIKADISNLSYDSGKDSLILKAVYETENFIYEDSMTIYTVDLPEKRETAQQETTETLSKGTAETNTYDIADNTAQPWLIILIIVIAAAITASVIVIIILRKKKKSKDSEQAEIPESVQPEETVPEQIQPVETTVQHPFTAAQIRACQITLTAIGHEENSYTLILPENQPKTVIRNENAEVLISDGHPHGSYCFELYWDGRILYLRDNGISGGTLLNGVPIKLNAWIPAENRSTVRTGLYEYRIKIEKIR